MSMAPHCARAQRVKMGNFDMVDTMIKDASGRFNGYHNGQHAENVARITDHRASRTSSRCLAEPRRSGAEGRQIQGHEIVRHRQDAGVTWSSIPTISRHGATLEPWEAQAGLRQGRYRDRRQRLRIMTAPPPWC